MTRHTPGPWHRNIKPATKYTVIFAGRNTHVAAVIPGNLDPAEVEANMCLVRAAPDLLAACQAAEGLTAWALDNGANAAAGAILDMIRAAIASADPAA